MPYRVAYDEYEADVAGTRIGRLEARHSWLRARDVCECDKEGWRELRVDLLMDPLSAGHPLCLCRSFPLLFVAVAFHMQVHRHNSLMWLKPDKSTRGHGGRNQELVRDDVREVCREPTSIIKTGQHISLHLLFLVFPLACRDWATFSTRRTKSVFSLPIHHPQPHKKRPNLTIVGSIAARLQVCPLLPP